MTNEQLRALLLESKRVHYVCDGDCWYSCPKSGECCNEHRDDKCDCGADAWNAKVDAALASPDETKPSATLDVWIAKWGGYVDPVHLALDELREIARGYPHKTAESGELQRLRHIETMALRVASSRRNGIVTDRTALDNLDAALETTKPPQTQWFCPCGAPLDASTAVCRRCLPDGMQPK